MNNQYNGAHGSYSQQPSIENYRQLNGKFQDLNCQQQTETHVSNL